MRNAIHLIRSATTYEAAREALAFVQRAIPRKQATMADYDAAHAVFMELWGDEYRKRQAKLPYFTGEPRHGGNWTGD